MSKGERIGRTAWSYIPGFITFGGGMLLSRTLESKLLQDEFLRSFIIDPCPINLPMVVYVLPVLSGVAGYLMGNKFYEDISLLTRE